MKIHSTLLIIGEMLTIHGNMIMVDAHQRAKNSEGCLYPSFCEDVEQLNVSYTTDRNIE